MAMLFLAGLGFQLRMEVHIPAALLSMVLVGHSTYLKELTGMTTRLNNGELHTPYF